MSEQQKATMAAGTASILLVALLTHAWFFPLEGGWDNMRIAAGSLLALFAGSTGLGAFVLWME